MHEYRLLMDGFEKKRRIFWEVARWEQFNQVRLSPNIKPFDKPQDLYAFQPFPWDPERPQIMPEQAHTTEDERAAFAAVIADMLQRRNQAS